MGEFPLQAKRKLTDFDDCKIFVALKLGNIREFLCSCHIFEGKKSRSGLEGQKLHKLIVVGYLPGSRILSRKRDRAERLRGLKNCISVQPVLKVLVCKCPCVFEVCFI